MTDFQPTNSDESVPPAEPARPSGVRRVLSNRIGRWVVAVAVAGAVIAGSVAAATSNSTTAAPSAQSAPSAAATGRPGGGGGGSNARSGPAEGGSLGTVTSVSASGFTLTTAAGQQVTVNEASSATYQQGTSATSASAVTTGTPVLVLGTTNGTTITATQVVVQPPGGAGSAASAAAGVVPFQRGAPAAAKQVGQIPQNYTEGSGTIVSGTTADQATKAALAAYPGGVVDRVVKLTNGEYEVHYIGVNWPHHIFVSSTFTVLGAD
jgi:hypothetical protein